MAARKDPPQNQAGRTGKEGEYQLIDVNSLTRINDRAKIKGGLYAAK